MEMTRLSKFFLETLHATLRGSSLDYGSRNGEIALALECAFADHRISNTTSTVESHYVSTGQELAQTFGWVSSIGQIYGCASPRLIRNRIWDDAGKVISFPP